MRALTDGELRLLVGLVDEEDASSQDLVRRQILGVGTPILRFLEEAQPGTEPRIRERLMALAREVRIQDAADRFRSLAQEAQPGLERGALLIAAIEDPSVDPARCVSWLDETARSIGSPLGPGEDPYPLLARLTTRLFEELRFRAAAADYYDPANSRLDQVIERRRGIPVTLSTVVLLVARRLSLPLSGAGLPGHFMVRVPLQGRAYFLDAFHRGRLMTRLQCRDFLVRSGYAFREEYLAPVSDREILTRILRNLISIYEKAGPSGRAERLSNLVEALLTGAGRRGRP